MSFIKLNKEKYTDIQVIIIVASIFVYAFLNRRSLTEFEGWVNFSIYTVFNLAIMISGKKIGSMKSVVSQFKRIVDGPGTAESMVAEAEYQMRAQAAICGIAWEKLNIETDKKIKKRSLRAKAKAAKVNPKTK